VHVFHGCFTGLVAARTPPNVFHGVFHAARSLRGVFHACNWRHSVRCPGRSPRDEDAKMKPQNEKGKTKTPRSGRAVRGANLHSKTCTMVERSCQYGNAPSLSIDTRAAVRQFYVGSIHPPPAPFGDGERISFLPCPRQRRTGRQSRPRSFPFAAEEVLPCAISAMQRQWRTPCAAHCN
jgi:hypothetical protein